MTAALSDEAVRELSTACAIDLTMFRRSHVEARVDRALMMERVGGVGDLTQRLVADDGSRGAFRRSVAISVTSLFRDREQFDALAQVLAGAPAPAHPFRAWSAGCSTGEEVWSIAATLARCGRAAGCIVLGSDLMPENIGVARAASPGAAELGAVIPRSARLRFEVRDLVNQGIPGGGWDLVLCRNVAIYLGPDQRAELHRALVSALRPGGLLMLGRSERLHDPRAVGVERVAPHLYRKRS